MCKNTPALIKLKKLESLWISENRATASKLEYHIKHLTKKQKEEIISLKSLDVLKDKLPIEIIIIQI